MAAMKPQKLGVSNHYVHQLCKRLTGTYFMGAMPCDALKNKVKESLTRIKNNIPYGIVINLSESLDPGTHFVALTCKDKHLVLFDSLDLTFEDPNITHYIASIQEKIPNFKFSRLKAKIQSFKSLMCAFYVIGYIISQSKGNESPKKFLKHFKEELLLNDKIIVLYILDYINKMH